MIEQQDNITRITNVGRYYEQNGVKYPNVTTILNYYPKFENFWKWKLTTENSETMFKDAGIKGSNIHKSIENYIGNGSRSRDLTESEKKYLNQFILWYKSVNPEVIEVEKFVINKGDKYAGTIDLIVNVNGQLWIVDIKTSKSLQTTHKLQLSAYKHALLTEQLEGVRPGYGFINTTHYKLALLHLKEDSYEFKEVDDNYELFLAVKQIFDYETSNNLI